MEKGHLLEKGEGRDALARELPAELAALVKQPQYAHFLLLHLTLPVEDTDGEFLRLALQVETTGGSVSERRILRLRRPEAELQRGSLRVLAVGIADYAHLPDLRYAAADALNLGALLQQQARGEILYRSTDITILTNADATLARLRQALAQLVANARPGDTLVVALSGHGIRTGEETYFAPARFDPENAAGTGLPWQELLGQLEGVRKTARAVWVLADCCRAAQGLRRELAASAKELKRGVEEGGNLIVCTASSGDAPSYESDEVKHGLFTQAWLEVLRGEVPAGWEMVYKPTPRGRVLTLSGLQFWLTSAVKRHADTAGVQQKVDFPSGLFVSFESGMPVFVPAK